MKIFKYNLTIIVNMEANYYLQQGSFYLQEKKNLIQIPNFLRNFQFNSQRFLFPKFVTELSFNLF